jgi:methanogenic corrinoid protein MtbC1
MTLQQVADAFGVHYMTAYRWVRLGQLAADKSAGVWHVTPDAVETFRAERAGSTRAGSTRAGSMPSPTSGADPASHDHRRSAPWADRLESRLTAGDGNGSWKVMEGALAAGADPESLYVDVLAPAMANIGLRWERGEIDVAVEHRASAIAMRLIGRLGPRFSRPGRTLGRVVIGAPSGEQHALPVAILGDLIRLEGWDVIDLGADVPASSFGSAVREFGDIAAVGVSVTTDVGLPAASEACRAVGAARRESDTRPLIVLGGAAIVDDAHAGLLGADAFAPDARSFVGLLAMR